MSTITWAVTQMDCYPQAEGQTDVVFNVAWSCTGVQDKYSAYVYGTQAVTYKADSPYTPYNQLTQDQVLGWVWDAGVDKAKTEANVQARIDAQINPPVVTPPLPWASN